MPIYSGSKFVKPKSTVEAANRGGQQIRGSALNARSGKIQHLSWVDHPCQAMNALRACHQNFECVFQNKQKFYDILHCTLYIVLLNFLTVE